jgi:hypothetical protein
MKVPWQFDDSAEASPAPYLSKYTVWRAAGSGERVKCTYSIPIGQIPRGDRMGHLDDVKMSYWQHWQRAWSIAFVLLVHGLIPSLWQTKASEMLCDAHESKPTA